MPNHFAECTCEGCERTGKGILIVVAFCRGDAGAGANLSPAIRRELSRAAHESPGRLVAPLLPSSTATDFPPFCAGDRFGG